MKSRRSESRIALPCTAIAVATFALTHLAAARPGEASGEAPSAEPPGEPDSVDAAEVESPETQQAREAFRLGSALAAQGQWADALAAFQRARRLRPHPVTTYNVGYVQRALGRLTHARKNLKDALAGGLPPDLQKEAQAYLSEIEPKLARIAVTITSEKTAIAVDGRPLEVEASGPRPVLVAGTLEPGPGQEPPSPAFDLLLDPGAHVFVLSREGAKDSVVNQSFDPGASLGLRLGVQIEKRPEPPAAPAPTPVADTGPNVEPAGAPRWPIWVAYGVGGAGIVAGSIMGGIAISKDKALEKDCPMSECTSPDDQSRIDSLQGVSLGSSIAFGVGAIGVATGTVLLFVLDDEPDEAPVAARLGRVEAEPWLGVGSAGVRGSF